MRKVKVTDTTLAGSLHQYVALIRGINVGGHSIVKMGDLRKEFESFGFKDVATYIQSGNVLFRTEDTDCKRLARQLEDKLASAIGRQLRVFVLSPAALRDAAANNPFDPQRNNEEQRCLLMFLSAEPEAARCDALMALQGAEYQFHIHGQVLYYAYARKYEGKRRTLDFEKVLGVTGTARSSTVIDKLIELTG